MGPKIAGAMQSNGQWQSMAIAPKDRFLLLAFMQNGKPQSVVGAYDQKRKCWVARAPHGGEPIEIHARKWHALPALPQVEF
jgi:hypothetical protein